MAGQAASGPQTDDLEGEIIAAIQAAGDTQYEKYVAGRGSERDDTLSVLRGWSSAVTLLEGSERRWRGGGYFLKWRGYGIVIDPGFDFLRNFHDAKYHGREINAVVVSHNHSDHNSDLKDIDDLRYELFKRLAMSKKAGSQPYVLLWDQDTAGATTFGVAKPQHRYEPVVLPSGFPQMIDLRDHTAKIPARLTPFQVDHGRDVPHAMGMLVELLDKRGKPAMRIGYTADTAYFPDLHQHLRDCDVLIAHISQPSIEELQDASKLKEVHLGFRGIARLLKECNPKLALIGEFWAGLTDLRTPLTRGLRQRSGMEAILPAGLGMHLRIPSLDIECTECGKPTPFSQIRVAPPTDSFASLAYLCPKCMIG
jgi:ribonuclease BN (tRNA processing enzyme)